MNGWILLHKKIWESENFKYQKNKDKMFLVWIWLLTHADENGKVTSGRHQISRDTGIHESSVKRALANIKSNMYQQPTKQIDYKATSEMTTISILNWHKYQRKPTKQATSEIKQSDQQATTYKEIKNKEVKELDTQQLNKLQIQFPDKQVLEEYEKCKDYIASTGKTYKDYEAMFRNWLRRTETKKENKIIITRRSQ